MSTYTTDEKMILEILNIISNKPFPVIDVEYDAELSDKVRCVYSFFIPDINITFKMTAEDSNGYGKYLNGVESIQYLFKDVTFYLHNNKIFHLEEAQIRLNEYLHSRLNRSQPTLSKKLSMINVSFPCQMTLYNKELLLALRMMI